jgi:hypothetical protein
MPILRLLTVLIVLTLGYILYDTLNIQTVNDTLDRISDKWNLGFSESICLPIGQRITNSTSMENYCTTKESCVFASTPSPLDCSWLTNADTNLKKIAYINSLYKGLGCGTGNYGCPNPPESHEIDCVANRCVDLRFTPINQ